MLLVRLGFGVSFYIQILKSEYIYIYIYIYNLIFFVYAKNFRDNLILLCDIDFYFVM